MADRDLTIAHDLTRTSAHDFTIASDLTRVSDLASTRIITTDLDRAIDLAIDLASDLVRTRTLVRELTHNRARAITLARTSARTIAIDLARALTTINFTTIELARVREQQYRADFIAFTRLFVLLSHSLACVVLLLSNTSPLPFSLLLFWKRLLSFQKNRHLPSLATEVQTNLNLCNEILSRLDQFERRQRGEEPAYEGLLIVKERKEASKALGT